MNTKRKNAKPILLSTLLAVIFSACGCEHKNATEPIDITWQLTALDSVAIQTLAANSGGDLFAATAPCPGVGIFRTSDKGNNWISLHPRICVRVLAVNPDGDIFATSGEAILRSTDNGESWALLQGLEANEFRAIAFQTPGVIFVGSMFHDESMGGIQRSSDNGDSWVQTSFPDTIGVYVLVTNSSGHLFAGTGYGVYRSEDYGDTWDQTNIGFRDLGYGQNVSALVIHPVNGSLFAALDYDGIYRSSDNGIVGFLQAWRILLFNLL
jgi:WD40 repeat protein